MDNLKSYDKYVKTFNYTIPKMIAEVETESMAKTIAKNFCKETVIEIPLHDRTETMTYQECALIVVKDKFIAYRICDNQGDTEKVEFKDNFVFLSILRENDIGYRYIDGKLIDFYFYDIH